jgi:hypothetical protein
MIGGFPQHLVAGDTITSRSLDHSKMVNVQNSEVVAIPSPLGLAQQWVKKGTADVITETIMCFTVEQKGLKANAC